MHSPLPTEFTGSERCVARFRRELCPICRLECQCVIMARWGPMAVAIMLHMGDNSEIASVHFAGLYKPLPHHISVLQPEGADLRASADAAVWTD